VAEFQTVPVEEIRGDSGFLFTKNIVIDGLTRIHQQASTAFTEMNYRRAYSFYTSVKVLNSITASYHDQEYRDKVKVIEDKLSKLSPYNNALVDQRFGVICEWLDLISLQLRRFKVLPAFPAKWMAGKGLATKRVEVDENGDAD
jgi:hypothetical protein